MARILFSALWERGGSGLTYARHIARSFPSGAGDKLSILSPRRINGVEERVDVEWIRAPRWTEHPITRFLLGAIYFRYFWPRRKDFDVILYGGGSFDVALPPGPKTIAVFHNMLPFDLESGRRYPLGWVRFRHWLLRYVQASAFRRADLVIFLSEYARRMIDAAVPDRKRSSVVITHGVDKTASPLASELVDQLPERFVLYLSILDVYKAQVELVEAWALLRQDGTRGAKLVLAGPEYPYYAAKVRAAIARHGLEEEVILLGPVHHDQVSDLVRRATLNVFLSSCENCPYILLELMCVGQPLLVSDREPMPELGGPGLDYVDPYDIEAVARAIARLLDDPARSARVGAAALEHSKRYSWARAGKMTWEAILRCAGASPSADRAIAKPLNPQATNVQR
jgi:glycosyltransferase involved in cell wall biosynthesis